jgi:hypothetical protein
MKKGNALQQYKMYHIDKNDERLGLFSILTKTYKIQKALYPGSFVHITPSFVIPSITYIDTDKRAKKFFEDSDIYDYVLRHKQYKSHPIIHFYAKDYQKNPLQTSGEFDLLISQYAGFVSLYCKQYLRIGGLLLVNNSHGDASMASIDCDYKLIGVLNKRSNSYHLSNKDLESYFVPKKPLNISKEYIEKIGRGIGYTKSPATYLFSRIG